VTGGTVSRWTKARWNWTGNSRIIEELGIDAQLTDDVRESIADLAATP
jgi:hypothetical protein